ncbi:hypothetical protein FRC09_017530 [Ceratobasidium sp. 395]|nr:hypothetical protein FRC09_017530 [Ceratobasidium sp. 395]
MFTTLEVERLAAKHKLLPVTSGSCRKNTGVPLFTIGLGHLGYVVGQEGEGFWTVGKLELSVSYAGVRDQSDSATHVFEVLTKATHRPLGISDMIVAATRTVAHTGAVTLGETGGRGLASIPGGYPGSYVEEVEEDEAD